MTACLPAWCSEQSLLAVRVQLHGCAEPVAHMLVIVVCAAHAALSMPLRAQAWQGWALSMWPAEHGAAGKLSARPMHGCMHAWATKGVRRATVAG